MKKILFTTIAIVTMSAFSLQAQNKLTVKVTGIENLTGKLYVAVYDAETPFMKDKVVAGKIEIINTSVMTLQFDELKNGEYAIAIYQDENSNGKLDLGQWGIPVEKYAFSNNVNPANLKRAPSFDECKFVIGGDTTVNMKLVHASGK